jgi:acetyl-CoA carboxylase biotin carboxylase subunit
VHEGYTVSPYYDSLIGKLIVYRDNREESIKTMQRALAEFEVEGIKTTIPLLRKILAHPDFAEGRVDTTFVERTWGGK